MASPFLSETDPVIPTAFVSLAQKFSPPRVAIARAGASLPMSAAFEAHQAGLMEPIFVGEADAISKEADALNWDISDFRIINTSGEAEAGKAAAELCGAGQADVLMKGHLHTDVFMKSALSRDAGLRDGKRFVHLFCMTSGEGHSPVVISDAALNVNPDLDTRKDATRAIVKLLNALSDEPARVAFLSATEVPIPSVPSSEDGAELSEWAKSEMTGSYFSGPLALDLILSEKSRDIKGLHDDPVAGRANGIVVPEIVSGNTLFKSMVYMSGACAGGLVVGGKVPILLTSRADSAPARISSVALASIWSNAED